MYVKLDGKIVTEVISDIDPAFPDVPIEKRYPADFIAELMHVTDGSAVEVGMEYNAETDSFGFPSLSPIDDFDVENTTDTENTGDITQAEINLEVEYRLSCLELGIN